MSEQKSVWQPGCNLEAIQARAELLALIRKFFQARSVLEVQTALLSRTTVTQPNLHSFSVIMAGATWYLQTSPEHQMKRLLAAGVPGIYQICPAFRQEERGLRHNPEFTLVEWYRPGLSMVDLMAEVAALVQMVLPGLCFSQLTYAQLFQDYFALNPHVAERQKLLQAAQTQLRRSAQRLPSAEPYAEFDRGELIDLLFDHACSQLTNGVFITEYPADQAALARTRVSQQEYEVADRFELVIDGLEIANGYLELLDAEVATRRMMRELELRNRADLPQPEIDSRLLGAMRAGLPDCAGVALGLDRLLMRQLGKTDISEVLAFACDRA